MDFKKENRWMFFWATACGLIATVLSAKYGPTTIVSSESRGIYISSNYFKLTGSSSMFTKFVIHRPGIYSGDAETVSFEVASKKDVYMTVRGGVLKEQHIQQSPPSWHQKYASFKEIKDKFQKGYYSYESIAMPGNYISRLGDWLIAQKLPTNPTDWQLKSMSFKIINNSAFTSAPTNPSQNLDTYRYSWRRCSASCGGGRQYGIPINCRFGRDSGCSIQRRDCNLHACPNRISTTTAKPTTTTRSTTTRRTTTTTTRATTTTRPTTTTPLTLQYEYGTCSVTCGSGTERGTPVNCPRGTTCPVRSRPCQRGVCPPPAPAVKFDEWSECTKLCGGGTQFKVDRCNENNYETCPREYRACNEQACRRASCPSNKEALYKNPSKCCEPSQDTCGRRGPLVSRRVIGGYAAEKNAWPWTVLMEVEFRETYFYVCGATIIDKLWVITAAHCVESIVPSMVKLMAGTNNINIPASTMQVTGATSLHLHEDYKFPANDLALVKLDKDLQFTSAVKPVCLPHGEQIEVDHTCFVAGWGIASEENIITETGSDILNEGIVKILPMRACVEGYKPTGYHLLLDDTMLCSGTLSGKVDTCLGDSGGPLMCQRCSSCGWFLAGVTSFGSAKCGRGNIPGIYTNVSKYQAWINKFVRTPGYNKNHSCNK